MIQIESEQQVLQEGLQILLGNMELSKVARFWAACQMGNGDYLKTKDELFAKETAASLYAKVLDFQKGEA